MIKAIAIKVLPPTDNRPCRLVAYDGDGNRLIRSRSFVENSAKIADGASASSWDQISLHMAKLFCRHMGWNGENELVGGSLGSLTVFVFAPTKKQRSKWGREANPQ